MRDDPYRNLYGHPLLPAGYNEWAINGTEFNSWRQCAGVAGYLRQLRGDGNPHHHEEMLDYFVTGCPDLVVAHVDDTLVMRGKMKADVAPQPSKVRVEGETTVSLSRW